MAAAMAAMIAAPAVAQVPYGANPATGARPGNPIGTGQSLPRSGAASNIDQNDTRSAIAPNLPSPPLGPNAGPADYLRAARASLAAGRTGEAQQSLEMAQTRLLDRSVPYAQTNQPSGNPANAAIEEARHALAAGDRAATIRLIDAALAQLR
jgi:hypothetical protein